MSRTRMLSELILETRQRADMVNSAFVTDLEVTRCINESWAQLYDALLSTGEDYYLKYVDLPAANTFGVDPPGSGSASFAFVAEYVRNTALYGATVAIAGTYDAPSGRVFLRIASMPYLLWLSPSTTQSSAITLPDTSSSMFVASRGSSLHVVDWPPPFAGGNLFTIDPAALTFTSVATTPPLSSYDPFYGLWYDSVTDRFVAGRNNRIDRITPAGVVDASIPGVDRRVIASSPGKMYALTGANIFVLDMATFTTTLLCLVVAPLFGLYVASSGQLYVGGAYGLYVVDVATGSFQSLTGEFNALGVVWGVGAQMCYDPVSDRVLVGSVSSPKVVAVNPATLACSIAFTYTSPGRVTLCLVSAGGTIVASVADVITYLNPSLEVYSTTAVAAATAIPNVFSFPNYTSSTGNKATDVYQVRGVDASRSGDFTVNVPRYNWEERNVMSSGLLTPASGLSAAYRVTQNPTSGLDSLTLIPATGTGFTGFRVWYYPNPKELVLSSDFIDGRSGWEEWVVVDAAIKLLAKEESDTSALEREAGRVWARVTAVAVNRDAGQSKRITDVSLNNGSWPMDGMYRNRR